LKELVKRCLEKHPRRRWQAIGDVRHELEVIAADPRGASLAATSGSLTQSASANGPVWRRALPVVAAVLITAAATAGGFIAARPAAPPAAPVTRFIIPYGEKENRTITSRVSLAISPDGTRIAYVSNRDIVLRNLVDFDSRVVSRGSVANLASSPFSLVFSPDGKQLAYWDQGDEKIKRIDLTGGAPIPVCDATAPGAINWIGEYLYFSAQGGLRRVAATGGQPDILVKTDNAAMLTAPWVLDDGRLLYSVAPANDSPDRWASAKIVVQRPGESTPTTLVEGGSDPRYVASGHLVYQVGGVLYARKFNPRTGALGDATSVVEGVLRGATNLGAGFGWYAVSATGTLLYMPGPVGQFDRDLQLAWFDRNGKADLLPIPSGPYTFPRVSPNGQYIAFTRNDVRESSIWVYAVGSTTAARRLTFGGSDRHPVWSSDNQRVFFESGTTGNGGIFWQRADGSGPAEQLTKVAKDERHTPLSMSPDGTVLLFDRISTAADNVQQSQVTLMTYSFKDKTTAPFGGVTSQMTTGAVFSPDGKWVAYSVRETGQTINTTFVQPYPATRAKFQISTIREDGHHQVWSGDGKELFYTPGPGLLMAAVTVSTTPSFTFGPAPPVSRPFNNQPPSVVSPFDVDRPGKRFLGLARSGTIDGPNVIRDELRIVLNWAEELKARVK
jgi:Tol biopolymer transport system component